MRGPDVCIFLHHIEKIFIDYLGIRQYIYRPLKMKCDDCGNDISGTYFETDGKTICKECYDKVQNNKMYRVFHMNGMNFKEVL